MIQNNLLVWHNSKIIKFKKLVFMVTGFLQVVIVWINLCFDQVLQQCFLYYFLVYLLCFPAVWPWFVISTPALHLTFYMNASFFPFSSVSASPCHVHVLS